MLAAEWLRREYRIVGRASLPTDQTAKVSSSSSVPTRLPVRLSLEEATLLLSEGIVHGIRVTRPIAQTSAPTERQLTLFREALEQNTKEMQELIHIKRRLEVTGFYSQLVSGLRVRQKRRSTQSREESNELPVKGDTSACSVRQRRRALRQLKKRQKQSGSTTDLLTYDSDDENADHHELDLEHGDHSPREPSDSTNSCDPALDLTDQPTLDNLLRYYEIGRPKPLFDPDSACSSPQENWRSCVPRHLPRATPVEWEREGEVTLIPLPNELKSRGIYAVCEWLGEQLKIVKRECAVNTTTIAPCSLLDQKSIPDIQKLLRCRVFADLWAKGAFITTSSTKMGGEFLVYPGDPLLYHASHVVMVIPPDETVPVSQLAARMRLANSVRKALVLATVPLMMESMRPEYEASKDHVTYTTIHWANWIGRT